MSASHKLILRSEIPESYVSISPWDYRRCGMVSLMFADYYVILIKGKNIGDGNRMQLTAVGAECDDSLIHLIISAFNRSLRHWRAP